MLTIRKLDLAVLVLGAVALGATIGLGAARPMQEDARQYQAAALAAQDTAIVALKEADRSNHIALQFLTEGCVEGTEPTVAYPNGKHAVLWLCAGGRTVNYLPRADWPEVE